MRELSGFLTTIVLLGAVQGLIASILLFFSVRNRRANRFLAWIILLIALACFDLYSNHKDWYGSDLLRFLGVLIPLIIFMPVGPLTWFYVRSSLDPDFVMTRKKRLHFLPIIIDFVPSLTALIYLVGVLTLVFKNNPEPWGIFIDEYNVYSDIPRWISMSLYSWLSYRLVVKHRVVGWLKQLTVVLLIFQVFWLIYLIPYIMPGVTNRLLSAVDWYPIYIPMVAMTYWLGIKGYLISWQVKKTNVNGNSLTEEAVRDAITRLVQAMEQEKLYLRHDLNLQILSRHTGLQQKLVSAVLNQHIHKSFNSFVNEYRIEAFKKKIKQAGMENLTMAGIAAECGFNSQATFQRSFRELTGMSPSEFRKTAS
jgi:AraC-like DNA-binding protein